MNRLIMLGTVASLELLHPRGGMAAPAGYCYPTTMAEIQQAINTPTCNDITMPAGVFSGSQLTIARSNIRLHGAGGSIPAENLSNRPSTPLASTILTAPSCVTGAFLTIGDASPGWTYAGIDLSDFAIILPAGCDMRGIHVRPSSAGSGNYVRRVRVARTGGQEAGIGVVLEENVWSWRFENVIVDHFSTGYHFHGTNNLVQVIGGECSHNTVCAMDEAMNPSGIIQFVGVDVEGNLAYGFDIFSAEGFIVRDCYIDNGTSPTARAIRIGAGGMPAYGTVIDGNFFNNSGSAAYAIELDSFHGVSITNNSFQGYAIGNVLNLAGAAGSGGSYIANDSWWVGTGAEVSSTDGFDVIHWKVGPNKGFKIY
jgi:hypothetical protein